MKHSKTKKSSLILLLLSMFLGVIFGMALLFTPKTADAYVQPKQNKGPLMGADLGGGVWEYCCGMTEKRNCYAVPCNE